MKTIDIYLYEDSLARYYKSKPAFSLDFETTDDAKDTFEKLMKDVCTSNYNFIKCGTLIFEKNLFRRAILH